MDDILCQGEEWRKIKFFDPSIYQSRRALDHRNAMKREKNASLKIYINI